MIELADGSVAIRYGDKYGGWESLAPTRVANFVLGIDVDTVTTRANERVLDVVQPVTEYWDPTNGVADILVFDRGAGTQHVVPLGFWVSRTRRGKIRILSPDAVGKSPIRPDKSFEEELTELVIKHKYLIKTDRQASLVVRYILSVGLSAKQLLENWGGVRGDV